MILPTVSAALNHALNKEINHAISFEPTAAEPVSLALAAQS
jgi:hypothetical protein